MVKTLIIADSDPRKNAGGGVATYSYQMAHYLTTHGHDVVYIGKRTDGPIVRNLGTVHYIDASNTRQSSNRRFLIDLFRISRRLNKHSFDVIHAQRPDWILPFRSWKGKKIVTLHGCHSKNVYLKKGPIAGFIYEQLERRGLQAADSIISVAKDTTDYYADKYTKIMDKATTIPVGIAPEHYLGHDKITLRASFGIDPNKWTMLYVGRLAEEKNVQLLIDACAVTQTHLVIAGEGPCRAQLEERSKQLRADVTFLGSIPHTRIPQLLACGDCLGLTSLYEGLPTVILEAFAAGLPVISTNVGDVSILVKDGLTGYLVNAENIADQITKIRGESQLFSAACKNMAANYSWDIIGSRVCEVYAL